MIVLDYFTYIFYHFFLFMGKDKEDAKLLAIFNSAMFLGFIASMLHTIYRIIYQAPMNVAFIKNGSVRIGLWTWGIASVICFSKYYLFTRDKLETLNKDYYLSKPWKQKLIKWGGTIFIIMATILFLALAFYKG